MCVCLSVFGNIIAIDADYSTNFKFNTTRDCCFKSHNDVPQVVQRNISIVAHTRHRSPYLPQPDCCCFVHFLITTSPPPYIPTPRISAERIHGSRTGRGASVHRPTRLLLLCFNSHNDVARVAQRNVSIVAHTRHRSPYLPQPDCCCFVSFLITTYPPASQRNVSITAERGVVRPSITQPNCCCCVSILITTTHPPISAERINGRSSPPPPPASFHAPTIDMKV